MKNRKSILKKILLPFLGVSILVSTPIILTSCSKIDSKLIDKTISKASGNIFASNGTQTFDIPTMTKQALKTDASAKALSSYIINELALNWLEKAAEQPSEVRLSRLLKNQKKSIDDEYKELVRTQKETHKENFPLKFQQDQLDINGGTEEAYKRKRLLEWAGTQFTSDLFNTNKTFLSLTKNGNVITNPLEGEILSAINEKNEIKFAFTKDGVPINKRNEYSDSEYAKFQEFIFKEWVKIEQPFVMNMSLWKYGTPKKGINTLYNKNATGVDDSTTPNAGNYSFPYFSSDSDDNNKGGTVTKFLNFLDDAKTRKNYISIDPIKAQIGLRDIDVKTYSEDSSTLIFSKNSDIFSSLVIEFAAAGTYLLNQALFENVSNSSDTIMNKIDAIQNIDKSLDNITDSNKTNGLDVISSLFVSTASSQNPSQVYLSQEYLGKIINETGDLKTLKDQQMYVIDAFKASNDELSDFMFVRNEYGVHAIAIEGEKYIKEATTFDESLSRTAKIVLYHYFMGQNESNDGALKIDINNELSTFYKNNSAYLISKYIEQNKTNQNLFNKDIIDENLLTLFNKLSVYLFELSRVEKPKEYNDKMHQQKQNYSNKYGVEAIKNGLAAGWIYKKDKNMYDVAKTVQSFKVDPFDSSNGSYKLYVDTIAAYVDGLKLQPLSSSFEGFKYSQYIYSNNYGVNVVLYTFGSDSTIMSDTLKVDVLSDYLKEDFDLSTLKFKSSQNFQINSTSRNNDENTKALNNAMTTINYSTTFDGLTNKWTQYNLSNGTSGTNGFDVQKLNEYKLNLYKRTLETNSSSAISTKVSILTIGATAKYLMENNGEKFIEYLNSEIQYGDDAYIAWTGNVDINLTNSNLVPNSVNALLDASQIKQNINNSFDSAYFGMKNNGTGNGQQNVGITTNTANSLFNKDPKYYNVINGKVGYNGLINDESPMDSKIIHNTLFYKDQNQKNTNGILYGYGSKVELIDYINSLSQVYQIQELAEDLRNKIPVINIDALFDNKIELKQAKKILNDELNNTHIADAMFNSDVKDAEIGQSNTIVQPPASQSSKSLIEEIDTPNMKAGAFAIPLNSGDIKNLTTLNEHLNKYKNVGGSNTTNFNETIYALLFDAATSTEYQDMALMNILTDNRKLTVYDTRLNTQLGPKWALNWKN